MGYRHYFYKADKAEVEKVKDMTYDKLFKYAKEKGCEIYDEEDNYFDFSDKKFLNQKEVFEFGKLYYENTDEQIYATGTPLFTNKEVFDRFKDYYPYVVGKQGLLKAIEIYHKKILDYFKGLLVDGDEAVGPFGIVIPKPEIKSIDKITEEIRDKIFWLNNGIVDLDESKSRVTSSWLYEYSIFNLVFLLKTINWEKETLLFYGW